MIELCDVVLSGLQELDARSISVSTVVNQRDHGCAFSLRSERVGESPREHCQGRGVVADASAITKLPRRARISELTSGCAEFPLADVPRWSCLKKMWRGDGEGVAEFELLMDEGSLLESQPLHPTLFDGALHFVAAWLPAAYVPCAIKRLRILAPLSSRLSSQIYYAIPEGEIPEVLELDITIRDLFGAPLVEVEGYSLRRRHDGSR